MEKVYENFYEIVGTTIPLAGLFMLTQGFGRFFLNGSKIIIITQIQEEKSFAQEKILL